MRAGVSNSDLVSALVLISLEHLTNLEQSLSETNISPTPRFYIMLLKS